MSKINTIRRSLGPNGNAVVIDNKVACTAEQITLIAE